ncbi:SDR family oxidoreductase [Actinoplanes bogorensis]|uniref:SDR family oxidoreductase n=1 Tax=Paractinoplanes bogorensis TaxID=1610840 RepID=A0ABS5YMX7_9ACTN|nr:SDR family oxidoreductase [Actinoplanes bogorensis]MBU2664099.1 SDR family oxidoreductase [Actinoplanes bogorensis]
MTTLDGRTAIVFGGGHSGTGPGGVNGIGFECALTFARHGANVVVVDRDREAALRSAKLIAEDGGECRPIVADALDEGAMAAAVDETVTAYGRIDIVQNNVGTTQLGGPEELSLEQWRRAVAINLDTVFLGAKYALPHLVATRGTMINVSSVASIRWTGYPYPAYSAAKAAVNQLTQSLAILYADTGVRVNAILAGLIDTPLAYRELSGDADTSAIQAARNAKSPTGIMGTARDVAGAALFLASDASAYVNGVLLPVDGGLHVRAA